MGFFTGISNKFISGYADAFSIFMNIYKIALVSGITGLIVPLAWMAFYRLGVVELMPGLVRFLWPSSILLIGDPEDNNYMLQVISVVLNMGIYVFFCIIFYKLYSRR